MLLCMAWHGVCLLLSFQSFLCLCVLLHLVKTNLGCIFGHKDFKQYRWSTVPDAARGQGRPEWLVTAGTEGSPVRQMGWQWRVEDRVSSLRGEHEVGC